jgi:hypothetical protein
MPFRRKRALSGALRKVAVHRNEHVTPKRSDGRNESIAGRAITRSRNLIRRGIDQQRKLEETCDGCNWFEPTPANRRESKSNANR